LVIGNFSRAVALVRCCTPTSEEHHGTSWTKDRRDHLERRRALDAGTLGAPTQFGTGVGVAVADRVTSAIQNIDGVVALLDLISVELLEMVEGLLSADLVDRLIELYEAAGLHDVAQEFTDELDRATPEVDWELW
jgi:hypothetical protein